MATLDAEGCGVGLGRGESAESRNPALTSRGGVVRWRCYPNEEITFHLGHGRYAHLVLAE